MKRIVRVQFLTEFPYYICGDVPVLIEHRWAEFTFDPLLSYHEFEFETSLSDIMLRAVLKEQMQGWSVDVVSIITARELPAVPINAPKPCFQKAEGVVTV